MNAISAQHKEVPNNVKDLIHAISILFVPTILIIVPIFIRGSLSGVSGLIFPVVFYTVYIALLYNLGGGFDWRIQRRSFWQNVAFWLVGILVFSLILYCLWYLIRLLIAKLFKIPFSDLKGKLLTNNEISAKAIHPATSYSNSIENQDVNEVSVCWFCSNNPASPQSVITEKNSIQAHLK